MEKPRILVVDDDAIFLKIYEKDLGKYFEVKTFDNAQNALDEIARGLNCYAILTDIMMPQMSGFDFVIKLQELKNTTPVVIMTSNANKQNAIKSMNLEVFAMIEKPYEKQTLVHTVKRAILAHYQDQVTNKLFTGQKELAEQQKILVENLRERIVDIENQLFKINPQAQKGPEAIEYLKKIKENNEIEKSILKIQTDLKNLEKDRYEFLKMLQQLQ